MDWFRAPCINPLEAALISGLAGLTPYDDFSDSSDSSNEDSIRLTPDDNLSDESVQENSYSIPLTPVDSSEESDDESILASQVSSLSLCGPQSIDSTTLALPNSPVAVPKKKISGRFRVPRSVVGA